MTSCEKNLSGRICMAIDIGGHLLKIVFLKHYDTIAKFHLDERKFEEFVEKMNAVAISDSNRKYTYKEFDVFVYLIDRSREMIEQFFGCIEVYSSVIFVPGLNKIALNGGGSSSMKKRLLAMLNKKILAVECVGLEFKASFAGINLLKQLNRQSYKEWYLYLKKDKTKSIDLPSENDFENYYKSYIETVDNHYILVYIGTSTSMLYISGSKVLYLQHSNISGGTFLGLCRLLCGVRTFEEALKASEIGNNKQLDFTMVDMLEGNSKTFSEMNSTTQESRNAESSAMDDGADVEFIINSFGKLAFTSAHSIGADSFEKNDIANALLLMVVNSATLSACQFAKKFNCKQIIFGGSFFLNNNYGKYRISKLVRYLTNDAIKSVFCSKDAFINAIGCLCDKHDVKIESFM